MMEENFSFTYKTLFRIKKNPQMAESFVESGAIPYPDLARVQS